MTPTWITERCACGAKFEITTTWHCDAANAADKWRTSHVHTAPDSPLICPESDEQGSTGTRTPQQPQTGTQGFNVGSYWCNNDTTTLGMDCTRCGATVYEYNDSTPMEDLAVLVDAALAHVCEVSHDVPRTNPQRAY